MVKNGILKIILRSDLCAGSGYAYAGVIDSDICYDSFGLPYIPARRLKGCMKEAAQSILYSIVDPEKIDQLFGVSGSSASGLLSVGDAKIEAYEKLTGELEQIKEEGGSLASYIEQQDILKQFTQVKAQTRIDKNGAAVDNSLRFTRVVNQYSPLNGEPLVFYAEVSLTDGTEELEKTLKQIVLATRSIGMHRNRGLGSVSCRIIFDEKNQKAELLRDIKERKGTQWVELSYLIKNNQMLMLGSNDDQASETLIRGQRVLGALAAAYLAEKGRSAQDQAFIDLFLAGKARFANLVPYKDGKVYYPAPLFLARLKTTKKIVNTQFHYVEIQGKKKLDKSYDPGNGGNQPKKLKGKYVSIDRNNEVDITEVEQCMVYHHSHYKKNADGIEGNLYVQLAVQKNQLYFGQIDVEERYAELIKELLNKTTFRFGRSRTAQYGGCTLVQGVNENREIGPVFSGKKGQTIMVALLSDGIFQSMQGNEYTVYYEELQKAIASELGILEKQKESDRFHSMIQTKEINGYNTMWNLHKQTVPAVAAGSVFVYELMEDAVIDQRFIGERNLEGYGQIHIFCLDEMQYAVNSKSDKNTEAAADSTKKREKKSEIKIEAAKQLIINCLIADWKEKMKQKAAEAENCRLSSSTIGKAVLMLQQSLEENRNSKRDAWEVFKKRIESVKREQEKTELKKRVVELIEKYCIHNNEDLQKEQELLLEIGVEKSRELLFSTWDTLAMEYLTAQKYQKKTEGE